MQAVTEPGQVAPAQSREIPQGCFCSSGLSDLRLPSDFRWLGSHACDNCKLLALVDLSCTSISVIQELTFSSFVRLQHIWLPRALHTIHVKAFMDCAVLREIAVPPMFLFCTGGDAMCAEVAQVILC